MEKNITSYRFERQEAMAMDRLISTFIREMQLTNNLNRQRIMLAWDEVSGAGAYTVNKFVKGGRLYCYISSSVVRSSLMFKKKNIIDAMNRQLKNDRLFTKNREETQWVKDIILK
ncbi:MAG: DciA family protein [Candidatus Cryptobacteroides sp.]